VVIKKQFIMKRLALLLLTAIVFISCDLGSEDSAQFVLGPVQDVTMATTYKVDSISEIMVRYKRPNDCHIFQGFYYSAVDSTRIVAIEYAWLDQPNYQEDPTVYEVPLRFKPQHTGTYVFRFWDGTGTDGEDHFYVAEAVVNH
jgi:hypothetical protein